MHFQISTGNSSGPTALLFFNFPECILHFFSTDTIYLFVNHFCFSVLGSLSFSSFISFSKYSFHLFSTASELTISLPFSFFIILTWCTSFPALSLCLANLHNSFSPSFVSHLAYKPSYASPVAIATAFFALLFFSLYTFLLFSSVILSHAFFSFMLSSTFSFHHHVFLSPIRLPNVTPFTVSAVFLSISVILSYSSANPSSLPKLLVTSFLNAC